MSIVGGLDIHRKQLTFDWVDQQNGTWERGRISPADREHLADWLTRFDLATAGPVAFAMEGCTGWRYIAEEMAKAGVTAHLAEPADTSALARLLAIVFRRTDCAAIAEPAIWEMSLKPIMIVR